MIRSTSAKEVSAIPTHGYLNILADMVIALRTAKNYTKGYSDTQAKVREATSNDPWGPSGTQMNELAQLTYNQCALSAYMSTNLGLMY